MKKLSIILTLMLTLSLYGCGKQETAVNEVSTDSVVESDSSNIIDEQVKEQTPSAEQTQDNSKGAENTDSDGINKTETADENKYTNVENNAADKETTDSETADSEAVISEETEQQSLLEYAVTTYTDSQVMYATDSVNVRKGPATDFERIGELIRGQEITVTGQADNNWYEILYGEETAYVSNKYLQNDKPSDDIQLILALQQEILLQEIQSQTAAEQQMTAQLEAQKAAAEAQKAMEAQKAAAAEASLQAAIDAQSKAQQAIPEIQPVPEAKNAAGIILVGDSRFVQMQESIGPNYCTWIAENAKGYTWFEEKAIPRIDGCVGNGSKIIINLGVNDTRNLQKYITLVNAKAAEWTALGATVYYASVNPVWENPYVTEEQVEYFNTQLHNSLGPYVHWIDSHSYLTSVGYKLVDGLHYSSETYQVIYAYLLSCM